MRYAIENEAHWHKMRRDREGASDVPIQFGIGYITKFERWHIRKGDLAPQDLSHDERVRLGVHLEPAVATYAQEKDGITLAKAHGYYTADAIGEILGATPDYWLDKEDSDTVVEIKCASWGSWKDRSAVHDDGFVEIPAAWQLQGQAQMACTGAQRAIFYALISGDRIVRYEMDRHEPAIDAIYTKVKEFQASLDNNIEPPAEMPADLDSAKKVWHSGDGQVDLRGDPDIEPWLEQLRELRDVRKRVEADADVIEARLLAFCVENRYASVSANNGKVSCKQMPAKSGENRWFKPQPSRLQLRVTTK